MASYSEKFSKVADEAMTAEWSRTQRLQSPPDSLLVLDLQGSGWQLSDLHEDTSTLGRLHIEVHRRRLVATV